MKKMLLTILVAIFTVGVLAACGSKDDQGAEGTKDTEGTEKKELVMGLSADFPPFETRDNNGKVIGFDVDLANYIADELGYEIEIKDMQFDGLIGALQSGTVDFVASGMSATEERKESVTFSTEYQPSSEIFITEKDSKVKTMDDLNGAKVGTQLGSIQEQGAKKLAETVDLEVKTLNKVPDLIQELKAGRIDTVLVDKAVADGYMKELDLVGFTNESGTSPGMAIAFPKEVDTALVEDFNKVIKEMEDNGELDKLREKWKIEQ